MSAFRVDDDFWHRRRVFVTGHSGFIGGWLSLALTRLGAKVTGFSLEPPTDPNFFGAVGLAGTIETSHFGDIRDLNAISQAMSDADPEIVFHLAAQPLVRTAYYEPVHTFATNVMGTVNVLEACRRPANVEAVIAFTTDKVYENQEWTWGYREDDRLGGREAYGASKAASEMAVDAYRKSYFESRTPPIGLATVRAGNVVGGGDWADARLVPDAVRAFSAGQPLWLRNPDAIRPWQHVLDPVRGLLTIAEHLVDDPERNGTAWNMGPPETEAYPVAEVVDEIKRLWGGGAHWAHDKRSKPYEARLLGLNSMRALDSFGWRTAWDLTTTLARTVDWYRAYLEGADMKAISLAQIAAHDAAAAAAPVDEAEPAPAGESA